MDGNIISELLDRFQRLLKLISDVNTVHINSDSIRGEIKIFIHDYFNSCRASITEYDIDTQGIDAIMQDLLMMANRRSKKSAYMRQLKSLQKLLIGAESALMLRKSQAMPVDSPYKITSEEQTILDNLEEVAPIAALSYGQVLRDLNSKRISYRGTASEIREALREVLEILAPDDEVARAKGFKLEKNTTKPTMKQKVMHILKNREFSKDAITAPSSTAGIIDESVARLARGTYTRGSISAHTTTDIKEIVQLKRYLDSILTELLEIP